MKKIMFTLLLASITLQSIGKKVKFAVNMTGQVLSPNGIHVSGDFQLAAGFTGLNWDCNVMTMTKEAIDTNIYSLVVDIPAFQKYEYKFINGDQCYEVEVVPESARANYQFSDNRWLYIDSLANDTTDIGAILFNGSAPQGLTLVRYKINMMQEASVSPNGVHVAGSFQSWNPATNRLYSFSNNIYEWIAYVSNSNYEFKYYNGNSVANSETVPGTCATNSNRTINVTQDTVLQILCYSSCNICYPAGTNDLSLANQISLYPNPMSSYTTIEFKDNAREHDIVLSDMTGKKIFNHTVNNQTSYKIQNSSFISGIYLLQISNDRGQKTSLKLIIQ